MQVFSNMEMPLYRHLSRNSPNWMGWKRSRESTQKIYQKHRRESTTAHQPHKGEYRCGKIKGRTVDDGQKQRFLYNKEVITLSTVSTDALLMTLVIDVVEDRFVANADVPGAYLQTLMPD